MSNMQPLARQAFTMIELMLVVAIIAILAGLIFPAINMLRDSAKRAQTTNTVKQINIAMRQYADEDPRHFFPTPDPAGVFAGQHIPYNGSKMWFDSATTIPNPADPTDFPLWYSSKTLNLLTKAGYSVNPKDVDKTGGPNNQFLVDGWGRPIMYFLDGSYKDSSGTIQTTFEAMAAPNANLSVVHRPLNASPGDWNVNKSTAGGTWPYAYIWSIGKPKVDDSTDAQVGNIARWIYDKTYVAP